ncbi:glycosyltransferase family 2 protein [Gemella sp. GH3]|uniref:glycosyltransferase family 2 protein n=1 Tax=unclassified Gemella TaxID=2624949 RepID=UPI0015CF8566|nr:MULTISPECIES: glycosyltransferase family A protein [unclassified Gemella]MBF0713794.1 glycosyltransferase family 2 protein [Gemella sp. GH3.1]NYS50746.1 glycosyltransferase family 2 protein [Gemella sp. GH3]
MTKNLNETKDVFVDTVLISDDILIKNIKTSNINYKISVILNSYRKDTNLINNIDNLLSQTYKSFEIIIIDDLSTDSMEKAFDSYKNYENINYIKKQLGSKSAAKNIGIDYARGEYIVFVEENIEKLENNYLEAMYHKINSTHSDVVLLGNDNNLEFMKEKFLQNSKISGVELITSEIIYAKNKIDSTLSSFIFRKQFLNIYNLRFNADILYGENIYFKLKVFDKVKKIQLCTETNYIKKNQFKKYDNKAIAESSYMRMMMTINKIEDFVETRDYRDAGNLLCGYLYAELASKDLSRESKNKILGIIANKKHYFKLDNIYRKIIVQLSPKLFVKSLMNSGEV